MLKKIQNWYNELRLESVDEVHKYRLTITFKNGKSATIDTDRYYLKPGCSFSEYFMILKEDRLYINGEFCPTHTIESITDEIIETEIIYVKEGFMALFGITEEKLRENQSKYKNIIDLYKSNKPNINTKLAFIKEERKTGCIMKYRVKSSKEEWSYYEAKDETQCIDYLISLKLKDDLEYEIYELSSADTIFGTK